MCTVLHRRFRLVAGRSAVAAALLVILAACGLAGGSAVAPAAGSRPAGRVMSGTAGTGRGMMGQGRAPRMMGRGQGVPPPIVTIVPTAAPNNAAPVSFSQDVLPILKSQCAACHGGQGGLWLDSYEQLMVGGTSGKVVGPGRPDQSLLYQRITGQKQPQMPLNAKPLSQNQIAAIRDWIAEGAPKN